MSIHSSDSFMRKLVSKSKEYGFEDSESCYMESVSMSVEILNKEVSTYENCDLLGVSFRGKINGKMGLANTTLLDDDSIDCLLAQARDNASIIDDDDEGFIYCDDSNKKLHYSQLSDNYKKNTYERFSNLGLELESKILESDSRIVAVDYLSIRCSQENTSIINSKGLDSYRDYEYVTVVAEARAVEDDVVKTAAHFWFGNNIDDFDVIEFVKALDNKLLPKFGAKSVKSGNYNIILGNEAFISLIGAFFSVFSSYTMQKGLSLLSGKEGEQIASSKLTISEIPMFDKAIVKVPFDSEGVLTSEKAIIKDGIFCTALYNLMTAAKANRKSTGNGFRSSYASDISISTTNLIVSSGDKSFDELCDYVGEGLYITDLNGLHAGVDTISGDFSLFCEGALIEGGKITRSVEQITIADNFFDIIKKIDCLGNDVISCPDGIGEMFAPSVVINDVAISGDV